MRWLSRVLVLLLTLLALTGCWSRREINDLALVTNLGFDLTDDGKLQVTMVIAQPAAAAGGKERATPTAQRAKVLLTREGRSVTEAMRLAELASPRQLNLTHVQVLVLGERLVEEGLDPYMDFLIREPQMRLKARVVVLKGAPVLRLLEADPIMESLQSQALREMEINQAGLTISLREYFVARDSNHRATILPVLELHPHQSDESNAPPFDPQLSGALVTFRNRVVAQMDREEVRGAMWLKGASRRATVTVLCPEATGPAEVISVRVIRADQKIEVERSGESFSFAVNLKATVRVAELHCPVDLKIPGVMNGLKKMVEEAISERVSELLAKTRAAEADPFFFGDKVRIKYPSLWPQVGEKRWGKTWSESAVRVETQVTVEHTGMTTNPAQYSH